MQAVEVTTHRRSIASVFARVFLCCNVRPGWLAKAFAGKKRRHHNRDDVGRINVMLKTSSTGRRQLVRFSTVKGYDPSERFPSHRTPPRHGPPRRPPLRAADSWTLVLVSLGPNNWKRQAEVPCCAPVGCALVSCRRGLIVIVTPHTVCTLSERGQEQSLLPLFLLRVMSISLFSPPPSPTHSLFFLLFSPSPSLAPSRQLWSPQKLISRVLTTMFFLPTAGFHLQSTGGQYLG